MRDAQINAAELDEVLLVGGTTHMPLLRRLVAGLFDRFPSMQLNLDEVVAIQATLKVRHASSDKVVLTDVCPYTLDIETTSGDDLRRNYGFYLPIIERNSMVPVSRVKTVSTLDDNQNAVKLCIFQGESRLVKYNIYLGELEVPVPPRRAGEVRIEVRFT